MKYKIEISDEENKFAPKQVIESQGSFDTMMNDIYRAVRRLDTTQHTYIKHFLSWCRQLLAKVREVKQ